MKKNEVKQWVKDHKKGIIIVGTAIVGTAAIATGAVVLYNRYNCEKALESLVDKATGELTNINKVEDFFEETLSTDDEFIRKSTKAAHMTSEHLRRLATGQKASAEKIAEASEKGIDLQGIYTWVDNYMTGGHAA